MSVLLNTDLKYSILLSKFIDNDRVKDFLFEFFICSFDKSRKPIVTESYEEFFGINEVYSRLKYIINET